MLFYLVGLEVAPQIEEFCAYHGLLFARWAGGASGSFGAKRVVFDGMELQSFAAPEDDKILISA